MTFAVTNQAPEIRSLNYDELTGRHSLNWIGGLPDTQWQIRLGRPGAVQFFDVPSGSNTFEFPENLPIGEYTFSVRQLPLRGPGFSWTVYKERLGNFTNVSEGVDYQWHLNGSTLELSWLPVLSAQSYGIYLTKLGGPLKVDLSLQDLQYSLSNLGSGDYRLWMKAVILPNTLGRRPFMPWGNLVSFRIP